MSRLALVRLGGPFDGAGPTPAAPATPTCCCCCCLVTTLTASTVAAVTTHREAEISGFDTNRRRLVTVAAALVIVLGSVPTWVLALTGLGSAFEDTSSWLIVTLWGASMLGVWLLWMRLVLGWAGSPPFPAWWWSTKFAFASGLSFTAELLSLGLFFYGQLAAVPIAVTVGVVLRRRFTAGQG